jgi:hypothetical protein
MTRGQGVLAEVASVPAHRARMGGQNLSYIPMKVHGKESSVTAH